MKKMMIDAATSLFDDSKNDMRALPKTVRLQLLTVLSFVWSTAFTLYVWGQVYAHIWTSLVVGHVAIIFAAYFTSQTVPQHQKQQVPIWGLSLAW